MFKKREERAVIIVASLKRIICLRYFKGSLRMTICKCKYDRINMFKMYRILGLYMIQVI